MTQYDRLVAGTATHETIAAEVKAQVARKPLHTRIPAHILVEDYLVRYRLEVRDVARIARIPYMHMNKFIRGEVRIDDSMAQKLGYMFKTGKEYWLNIQAAADEGTL